MIRQRFHSNGSTAMKAMITASSTFTSYVASFAFDGLNGTTNVAAWLSADGSCNTTTKVVTGVDLQFDYGEVKNIHAIRMAVWGFNSNLCGFPGSMNVYISDTGSFAGEEEYIGRMNMERPGGPGADATYNQDWSEWAYLPRGVYARYIKFEILTYIEGSVNTGAYLAVNEIEFLEDAEFKTVDHLHSNVDWYNFTDNTATKKVSTSELSNVKGAVEASSGLKYFEVKVKNNADYDFFTIGFGSIYYITTNRVGALADSWGYRYNAFHDEGTPINAYFTRPTTSRYSVWGIFVDIDNGKWWLRVDGNLYGWVTSDYVAVDFDDIVAGTNPAGSSANITTAVPLVPMFGLEHIGSEGELCLTKDSFTYPDLPTGYEPWSSEDEVEIASTGEIDAVSFYGSSEYSPSYPTTDAYNGVMTDRHISANALFDTVDPGYILDGKEYWFSMNFEEEKCLTGIRFSPAGSSGTNYGTPRDVRVWGSYNGQFEGEQFLGTTLLCERGDNSAAVQQMFGPWHTFPEPVKARYFRFEVLSVNQGTISTGGNVAFGDIEFRVRQSIETGFNLDWVPVNNQVAVTLDSTNVDTTQSDFPVTLYLNRESGLSGTDLTRLCNDVGGCAQKLALVVDGDVLPLEVSKSIYTRSTLPAIIPLSGPNIDDLTSWIGNATDKVIMSASSTYSSYIPANMFTLFDGVLRWISATGTVNTGTGLPVGSLWFQVTLREGEHKILTHMAYRRYIDTTMAKEVVFKGSNTGDFTGEEVDLLAVTLPDLGDGAWTDYIEFNPDRVFYKYIRVQILSVHVGSGSTYVQSRQVAFMYKESEELILHTKLPSYTSGADIPAQLYWDKSQFANPLSGHRNDHRDLCVAAYPTNTTATADYNRRFIIKPEKSLQYGKIRVRVHFMHNGTDWTLTDSYVGMSVTSTTADHFETGYQKELTFSGQSGTVITATNYKSDIIEVLSGPSRYLIVSFHSSTLAPSIVELDTTRYLMYEQSNATSTSADADPQTMTSNTTNRIGISRIEIIRDDAPVRGIWGQNYKQIVHPQDPTLPVVDSAEGKVLKVVGTDIQLIGQGKDTAIEITADDSFINLNRQADITGEGTMEVWAQNDAAAQYDAPLGFDSNSSTGDLAIYANDSNTMRVWDSNVGFLHTLDGTFDTILNHYTLSFNNTPLATLRNITVGTNDTSSQSGVKFAAYNDIGNWGDLSARTWQGKIANVRISDVERDADWLGLTNLTLLDGLATWDDLPIGSHTHQYDVIIPGQSEEMLGSPVKMVFRRDSGTTDFDTTAIFKAIGGYWPKIIAYQDEVKIPVEMGFLEMDGLSQVHSVTADTGDYDGYTFREVFDLPTYGFQVETIRAVRFWLSPRNASTNSIILKMFVGLKGAGDRDFATTPTPVTFNGGQTVGESGTTGVWSDWAFLPVEPDEKIVVSYLCGGYMGYCTQASTGDLIDDAWVSSTAVDYAEDVTITGGSASVNAVGIVGMELSSETLEYPSLVAYNEGTVIENVGGTSGDSAFDDELVTGDISGAWYAKDSGGSYDTVGWVGKDWGAGVKRSINLVSIYINPTYTSDDFSAKDIRIEVSDDGTTYSQIAFIDDLDYTTAGWHNFPVPPSPHRYIRFNVLSNWGDVTYLVVQELRFFEVVEQNPEMVLYTKADLGTSDTSLQLNFDPTNADNLENISGTNSSTLFDAGVATVHGGGGTWCYRVVIPFSELEVTHNGLHIQFPYFNTSWTINAAWIYKQASSGDAYDAEVGSGVQIKRGGSTSFTIVGIDQVSDLIDFNIEDGDNIVIAVDTSGGVAYTTSVPSNCTCYYGAYVEAATENATTGYTDGTTIFWSVVAKIHEGNPSHNVWDDNFMAVYHANQMPVVATACILDSTSNFRHMTPTGTFVDADWEDSPYGGKAIRFDQGDYLQSLETGFDPTDASINMLVKPGAYAKTFITIGTDNYQVFSISQDPTSSINLSTNGSSWTIAEDWDYGMAVGGWYGIGLTSTTGMTRVFDNGVNFYSNAIGPVLLNNDDLKLFAHYALNATYNGSGSFAEAWFSKSARSSAWMTMTDANMKDELVSYTYSTAPVSRTEYEVNLTIAPQDETLLNFPVTVLINDSSGINNYDLTTIFATDPSKLILKQGDQVLPVEIEQWEILPEQRVVADTDPIHHYTMDNVSGTTVYDEIGTTNGTITGFTETAGGVFDHYLSGGSIASVDHTVDLGGSNVAFVSISMWIRLINNTDYHDWLSNSAVNRSMYCETNGDLYFWNSAAVAIGLAITDTGWHHIAIVEGTNNNNHWVFLDGVKSASEITSNAGAFGGYRYFGRVAIASHYAPDITNCQIYDYKLTDSEVSALSSPVEIKRAVLHTRANLYPVVDTVLTLNFDPLNMINDSIGYTGSSVAQSVWNSNFLAVYHMAQDPSGTAPQILDSTSSGFDGTSAGTMLTADLVDMTVGKGLNFDGSDDYIDCSNDALLNPSTALTLEALVFRDNYSTVPQRVIARDHDSLGRSYAFGVDNNKISLEINGAYKIRNDAVATLLAASTYYNIAMAGDTNNWIAYVDGVQDGSSQTWTSPAASTGSTTIGRRNYASSENYFAGSVGEVRISNIARSATWIEATNNSLTDALITYSLPDVPVDPDPDPVTGYRKPRYVFPGFPSPYKVTFAFHGFNFKNNNLLPKYPTFGGS